MGLCDDYGGGSREREIVCKWVGNGKRKRDRKEMSMRERE